MKSGFAKIRNLNSYEKIGNGDHIWDPSEIAAEDYVQLFGSNTGKKSMVFEDARDQVRNDDVGTRNYTTLVYNLSPPGLLHAIMCLPLLQYLLLQI